LAGARGHGGRHTTNANARRSNPRSSQRCGVWGSGRLPQGGEPPFPLPRGLGGRCGRRRRGHRRTPGRPSGARWSLRGTRRLSCRLPGSGRSRARPRRCLLYRLRGSGRGERRLPPLGESPSPIALLLVVVRRRVLRSCQGGESQLLAEPKLLTPLFPVLPPPDPLLLLARRPLLLPPMRRARGGARGVGGSDRVAFTVTSCKE
jgi:hypothetical protein